MSTVPKLPLRCEIRDGVVVIEIGIATYVFAAEHHPDFYDEHNDRGRMRVTDPTIFAEEVVRALNDEAEDGSTLVTRLLDQAVLDAICDGAQGIKER